MNDTDHDAIASQLLAAIYAEPDDDTPRLVYADALLERGEPRGELITLQCRSALDPAQRAREAELLAAHGRRWLGDLAAVVADHRFERGFLATCRVDTLDVERVRATVGNPSWSTVRELHGSALVGLDPVMRALRGLHFDEGDARRRERLPDAWRDLLIDTPRDLVKLHYHLVIEQSWSANGDVTATPDSGGVWTRSVSDEQVDALCRCAALPMLRELVVEGSPELWAQRLLAAPVLQRLDSLGFAFHTYGFPVALFIAALHSAPIPTLRFTMHPTLYPLTARLDRGDHGYARVAIAITPTAMVDWHATLANETCEIIAALPPSVTELRIAMPPIYEPRERVRAAAQALPQLVVCELA